MGLCSLSSSSIYSSLYLVIDLGCLFCLTVSNYEFKVFTIAQIIIKSEFHFKFSSSKVFLIKLYKVFQLWELAIPC